MCSFFFFFFFFFFFLWGWESGGGGESGLERRAGEGDRGCGISGKGSISFKTPGQHKFAASCHSRSYEKNWVYHSRRCYIWPCS